MAFTTRTARLIGNPADARKSADRLGPGSYNIASGSTTRVSYAPFSSSSERGLSLDMYESAPGPGRYFQHKKAQIRAATSSGFVSGVRRFDRPGIERNDVPGPGQYDLRLKWGKKQRPVRTKQKGQKLNWKPKKAPPSIPTAFQSWGYEEASDGSLVLQNAPKSKFRYHGVPGDLPGPGEYDPYPVKKTTKQGVDFASSKTHRGQSIKVSSVGPGSYTITGVPAPRGPALNTSSFASRSNRGLNQVIKTDAPGPGRYGHKGSFEKAAAEKNPRFQYFGSTQPKATLTQATAETEIPGPGHYSVDISSFKKALKDDDMFIEPDRVAFTTSAARFAVNKDTELVPGPGSYVNPPNVALALSRKQFGRNNTFNTTVPKFSTAGEHKIDLVPGPGAYVEKRLVRPVQRLSSFASKTRRFQTRDLRDKAMLPGPGQYDHHPASTQGAQVNPSHVFSDERNRFSDKGQLSVYTHESTAHLAPGSYDIPSTLNTKGPGAGSSFVSTSKRFAKVQHNDVPGPGRYANPADNLNKKSYNISFG